MKALTFLFLVILTAFAAADDDFVITKSRWTLIASKGDQVNWNLPTASDMANLVCHSDNIRTRTGKKLSIPEKLNLVANRVQKRTGRRPQLKVETFSYPRFQTMDTIYRGKRGYFNGWARKEDPGIVEAQAIRTEMYIRLSVDGQFVHVLMRRFYREWAAEWCTNDQLEASIGVRDDQTMPIPRHMFERVTVREVIKEVVNEIEKPIYIEQPSITPPIVVPWNGSYHSQGSIYNQKELAQAWFSWVKRFKCKSNCTSKYCNPDDKPTLPPPPPPPPGDGGTPPNNDENYPPPSSLSRRGLAMVPTPFGFPTAFPVGSSLWL